MDTIAWRPDRQTLERAQLTRFLQFAGCANFEELYRSSIEDIPGFTAKVLGFLEVRFRRPWTRMLDLSEGLPWGRWCIGGVLNIADSCLRHPPEQTAIIWEGEEGATRSLTYSELKKQVDVAAAGLRALGVKKGDAVAIHLPMLPETVIALLATAQIGAVAVPLFSGYGPSALASRIQDVGAKVIITCDAFPRRGKSVPAKSVMRPSHSELSVSPARHRGQPHGRRVGSDLGHPEWKRRKH